MLVCCCVRSSVKTGPNYDDDDDDDAPCLDRARPNHKAPARSQTQSLLRRFVFSERHGSACHRGVATVASAVTADGLPLLRGQGLFNELRRSRSATGRDRCDAGRVLPDHRVLIARSRPFSAGLESSPGERLTTTGSSDLASDSSTRLHATYSRLRRHRHLCGGVGVGGGGDSSPPPPSPSSRRTKRKPFLTSV